MNAAQAFSDHFLPKQCLGKRSLRQCRSQKRDNIVLIEVDSDDFGDVIILDVPDSFRQKFKKRPKNVISLDDDDDDDGNAGENTGGACDTDGDAATRNACPATSAAHASNSPDLDEASVSEGTVPVKLPKSHRTFSGKNISRNRYGLSSDSECCSSESDDSDCELMGVSLGRSRRWWEEASMAQGHDTRCGTSNFNYKAGCSESFQPAQFGAEEVTAQHSPVRHNNASTFTCDHDTGSVHPNIAQKDVTRDQSHQQDSDTTEMSSGPPDLGDKVGTSTPSRDPHGSTADYSDKQFCNPSNPESSNTFGDFAENLAGRCDSTLQNCDAKEMIEISSGGCLVHVSKGYSSQDFESNLPASSEGGQVAVEPSSSSEGDKISDVDLDGNEKKSSSDQDTIVTDRQKIKETDEYKRATEEEWASRQQQLQRQAEEARRLRDRKRAESMRIMVNKKRQMQRVQEIRETRRKDEEKLNLKDKLRSAIKNELRRLEMVCGDMASLLRCLGIPVGGGLYPSQNEVQAAYKRACLKFHPDRVSTNDLQRQVEAEEKFKLISNMKDKFL